MRYFKKILEYSINFIAVETSKYEVFEKLQKRFDIETVDRKKSLIKYSKFDPLKITVVFLATLFLAFFLYGRISYYFNWLDNASNHSHVINLTKEKIKWDVFYGESPKCGEVDCHVDPSYSDDHFLKKVVLPVHEFPLVGYEVGQKIFLRSKLKITSEILNSSDAITFHSLYIWAKTYQVFLNGKLVAEGITETVDLSIPKSFFNSDGIVDIAFKIDPGDLPYQGIAHKGYVLLGSKKALESAKYQSRELKTLYYVWFLIPTAVICLILSLLYLTVYRQNELFYFVMYGFFASLAIISKTAYSDEIFIMESSHLGGFLKLNALVCLFGFIHNFFRRSSKAFNLFFPLLLISSILIFLSIQISKTFAGIFLSLNVTNKLVDGIDAGISVYGATLALLSLIYVSRLKIGNFRFVAAFLILALCSFSFMSLTLRYFDVHFSNSSDIQKMIFDLGFFVLVGGLIAVELGIALTQKKILKSEFEQFVDPEIAQAVLSDISTLKPSEKFVSVFFSDIRGFTTICEDAKPKDIFEFLEDYRSRVLAVVRKNGGYIDKCVGDAVMAFWGAPKTCENPSYQAVKTAIEMRKVIQEMNAERVKAGKFEFRIGMGISSGYVSSGVLSTQYKKEYTVIGDSVNVAARLEGLTKSLKSDILIDQLTFDRTQEKIVVQSLGSHIHRGREKEARVFKVISIEGEEGEILCFDPLYEDIGKKIPKILDISPDNLISIDYQTKKNRPNEAG